ncbi:D-alanyl-D-alanine carboxypeptidase family protein [Roseateles sp.]|uniref:D-alanyl-D-alanine carboxypeptidase family protein n=1 Tax=Roseateles sp. TaxID=1971397 RepID=UPI003D0C638A
MNCKSPSVPQGHRPSRTNPIFRTRWPLLALSYLPLALCLPGQLAQAQLPPARPAVIASTQDSGNGYISSSTAANGLSALISRWDTPYPGGPNGPQAPGLEPSGRRVFSIDVDVNDGGLAAFGYAISTYDAGIYDWYDIHVETPTGNVPIVTRLGQPGSTYGVLFESPVVTRSINLNPWRNQRVRFVFAVTNDGWGDQTQGRLIGFTLSTCTVPPLTPLTDATAISFEGGASLDTANLTQRMRTALSCVQTAAAAAGGTVTVASAYRPPQYQQHLREVWDKWDLLRDMREPECVELRTQVQAEFQRHGLLLTQRPAASSQHTLGEAIDMRSSLTAAQFATATTGCLLNRPLPVTDPVHYVHQ